jgi:endonuclease/exonuclease/phosphatase family protein
VTLLLRTWNVFHGKTSPPSPGTHLEAILRLASSDRPAVLFLQEVPAWAVGRLGEWSGMTAIADITVKPLLGPLGRATKLGPLATSLTSPNGRMGRIIRLLLVGQANAILLDPSVRVVARSRAVINPRRVRREKSEEHGLGRVDRLKWGLERRGCLALRITLPDQRTAVVANLHTTAYPGAVAEIELEQAVAFATHLAGPGDVSILAGDFNLTVDSSRQLRELTDRGGYSSPGSWVDQILVRDADPSPPEEWTEDRRRTGAGLLSDHSPLDVRIR